MVLLFCFVKLAGSGLAILSWGYSTFPHLPSHPIVKYTHRGGLF